MQCPKDQTELNRKERLGIEIDVCPKCNGVWLDRGELDKIIERTREDLVSKDPPKGSWETPRVGTMPAGRVQVMQTPVADRIPTWDGGRDANIAEVETAGDSSVPFKDSLAPETNVEVVDGDERGVNAKEVVAEEYDDDPEHVTYGEAREGEPVLDRPEDKKANRRNFFEELFDFS